MKDETPTFGNAYTIGYTKKNSPKLTLHEEVRQLITCMIRSEGSARWKIIVADSFGQSIIRSLFSTSHLKMIGVTLILSIDGAREHMKDVPAAYFMLASTENLKLCARDIVAKQYAEFRLFFLEQCSTRAIETLASCIREVTSIENVFFYDTPMQFFVLHRNLYTLLTSVSVQDMKKAQLQSTQSPRIADSISAELRDLFEIAQLKPSIAYIQSPIAQSIAQNLASEAIPAKASALSGGNHILLLLDRNFDLLTPIRTPFSYGELLVDLLRFEKNMFFLSDKDTQDVLRSEIAKMTHVLHRKGNQKTIDVSCDAFWEKFQSADIGDLCEQLETSLHAFQLDKDAIAKKEGPVSLMGSTSELLMRKASLDKHSILSKILLLFINDRSLDEYNDIGTKIIDAFQRGATVDFTHKVTYLIASNESKGSWTDRGRLLLIFTVYAHALEEKIKGNLNLTELICAKLSGLFPTQEKHSKRILHCAKNIYLNELQNLERKNKPFGWIDQTISSAAKTISHSMHGASSGVTFPLTELVDGIAKKSKKIEALSTKFATISGHFENSRQKKMLERLHWNASKEESTGREQAGKEKDLTIVICIIGGYTFGEYFDLVRWQNRTENSRINVLFGGSDVICGRELLQQLLDE